MAMQGLEAFEPTDLMVEQSVHGLKAVLNEMLAEVFGSGLGGLKHGGKDFSSDLGVVEQAVGRTSANVLVATVCIARSPDCDGGASSALDDLLPIIERAARRAR